MVEKLEQVLNTKNLIIENILICATPEIDVLAIQDSGITYARKILSQLDGRGTLYGIDPHSRLPYPTYPLAPEGYLYVDNPEEWAPELFDFDYIWASPDCLKKAIKTPPELAGIDPKKSIIICDDVIEGVKHTFSRVRDHLETLGYDFDNDNPPHFGAVECLINYTVRGYTPTSGYDPHQIRLVRNFGV